MEKKQQLLAVETLAKLREDIVAQFAARGFDDAKVRLSFDCDGDFLISMECESVGIYGKSFYIFADDHLADNLSRRLEEIRALIANLPTANDYRTGKLREAIVKNLAELDELVLSEAESAAIRAQLASVIESLSSNILEDKTSEV